MMRPLRRFMFGGLLLICVCMLAGGVWRIVTDLPTVAQVQQFPVIILDPGHGGADGGAEANGVMEKHINLNIAMNLRDMLIINGFDVIMARETDISIHDEGISGIRKQKVSDLNNRLAIANKYPNAIFVSIHLNKFSQASSHGSQVFYSENHPDSQLLASIIQQTLVVDLQPTNHRKIKPADSNLFLIYNASCPSVLVECGFLSNSREAAMLADEGYQNQLAFSLFSSLIQYLESGLPGTPNT